MSEENIQNNTSEVSDQPKEMTLIEKVSFMSDLANASKNTELLNLLKKLPSGDKILGIFTNAIEKELQTVMSGKKDDVPKQVSDMASNLSQMNNSLRNFREMMTYFMSSPLVEVLNMMNKNLGGKSVQKQPNFEQHNNVEDEGMRLAQERFEKAQAARSNASASVSENFNGTRGNSRGVIGGSF